MISPTFYDKNKSVKLFMGGKIPHYIRKAPTVVLQKYPYTVQEGEDMYTLGYKIFGANRSYLWTIIADSNRLRQPDDVQVGETVFLPEIILNDPENRAANYESASSFATAIRY